MKLKSVMLPVIALPLSLLAGCASTTSMKLSQKDEASIHRVRVSNNVQVPKKMFYYSDKASYGQFTLGIVGVMLAAADDKKTAAELAEFAKKHNIDIKRIVREQIIKQLRTKFKVASNAKNADATMFITIKTYGLGIAHGFSHKVKPKLFIEGKLVNRRGRLIWDSTARVFTMTSGTPSYDINTIEGNPQKLAYSWRVAAKKAANRLIKTL